MRAYAPHLLTCFCIVTSLNCSPWLSDLQDANAAAGEFRAFKEYSANVPQVLSIYPNRGTRDVGVSTPVTVSFSKPMDAASVEARFSLSEADTPVTGTFAWPNPQLMEFTPDELSATTAYDIALLAGAVDVLGVAIDTAAAAGFTTGDGSTDSLAPRIVSVTPSLGENATELVEVPVKAYVGVGFSKAMDRASVEAAFSLVSGAPVAGSFEWSTPQYVIFRPSADLAFDSAHEIVMATSAADLAGNPLQTAFSRRFTTSADPDTTPPEIVAVTPEANTEAPVETIVTVRFNEQMDPASVIGSLQLSRGTRAIDGTFTWAGDAVTFTPAEDLEQGRSYRLTVADTATDVSGNPLSEPWDSAFDVAVIVDTTPPTVESTEPAEGATDIPHTAPIRITFSEPMDAGSVVLATTFRAADATVIPLVFEGQVGRVSLFRPALTPQGGDHTVRVDTQATDIAGNALSEAFEATFTMLPPPDITPPGPVTAFTATAGDEQIDLSWTNPADADFAGVRIVRGETPPTNPNDGTIVCDPCTSPLTDTMLTNLTTYHYAAYSYDGVPNYAGAATASATPEDVTPPGVVTNPVFTAGYSRVTIEWNNPTDDDLAGVLIRRSDVGFPSDRTQGELVCDPCTSPYDDETVTNEVEYFYSIIAYDEVPNDSAIATGDATPSVTLATWSQTGYLKASDAALNDNFGGLSSFAVENDILVIGSEFADTAQGTRAGKAYIFQFNPGLGWSQVQILTASDGSAEGRFGRSIAMLNGVIFIGSEDSSVSANRGAVYVFEESNSVWSQEHKIVAVNASSEAAFGNSLAVSIDRPLSLFIGAYAEDADSSNDPLAHSPSCCDYGAAYEYEYDGTSWTFKEYFKRPAGQVSDWFGNSIHADSNYVVIGAHKAGQPGNRPGYVYVYSWNGSTWTSSTISSPNPDDLDLFGEDVFIDYPYLFVGSPFEEGDSSSAVGAYNNNAGIGAGAVYIYTNNGSSWSFSGYLKAPNAATDHGFGTSISYSDNTLTIGADPEDGNLSSMLGNFNNTGSNVGAIYVYHEIGGSWLPYSYLKASNGENDDRNGKPILLSGDTIFSGARFEDGDANSTTTNPNNNATDSGAVYVFERN